MEELICSSTVVLLSYLNSGICTLIRKKNPKTLKMGRKEGRNYRSSDYNMYNVRRYKKKKSRMWVREDLKTIIRSQCSIGILENQKD